MGDADTSENIGPSPVDYSPVVPPYEGEALEAIKEQPIRDIWDALRVNEPTTGADPKYDTRQIGFNNLEINLVGNGSNIDVVYTPMSRMLWKSEPQ